MFAVLTKMRSRTSLTDSPSLFLAWTSFPLRLRSLALSLRCIYTLRHRILDIWCTYTGPSYFLYSLERESTRRLALNVSQLRRSQQTQQPPP